MNKILSKIKRVIMSLKKTFSNKNKKINYNFLTPADVDNPIQYNKLLERCFKNKDVKNIAISGIYSSGKTTFWKSYLKYKGLKENEVITVVLGKYHKSNDKEDNEKSNLDNSDSDKNNNNNRDNNNRLERQLLNQIAYQI